MHPPASARAHWTLRTIPLALAFPIVAGAQTLDDGLTVGRHELRSSVYYANDRWSEYWEGTLKRTNDNVGTVTTQSVTASAIYGVTKELNVLVALPYVWTNASQGVLSGMEGAQDLTVAAKFRFLRAPIGHRMVLGANMTGGVATPTTNYTPEFLPMSIGLGSRVAFARASVHLKDRSNFFADGSFAHVWRSTVTLDRPAYYTDGALTLSDEVAMPDVSTWMASLGFQNARWCIPVGLMGQRTLGGGDIRRQDMPFVSNRMDFTRAHAMVMYTLPVPSSLIVGAGAARTLSGRNVGQSTTFTFGVTHAVRL